MFKLTVPLKERNESERVDDNGTKTCTKVGTNGTKVGTKAGTNDTKPERMYTKRILRQRLLS